MNMYRTLIIVGGLLLFQSNCVFGMKVFNSHEDRKEVKSYYGLQESDSAPELFSTIFQYIDPAIYTYSLYSALNKISKPINGTVDLRGLELFFYQVYQKVCDQITPNEPKKVQSKSYSIKPNKLELCLGAASCIVLGSVLGWAARSWYSKSN